MKRKNRWVLLACFTVLAIVAAALGFLGLNVDPPTRRVLIFAFIGVCVGLFVWGVYFGRRPPPVPPSPPLPPV